MSTTAVPLPLTGGTITIPPQPKDPFDFSPELVTALKEKYGAGATDAEFTIFIEMCKRRRLVPGTQVHLLMRKVWEYDEALNRKVAVKRATYVTSIDSFRIIAQRSGEYQGPESAVFVYASERGSEVKFEESPYPFPGRSLYGVKFTVRRKGFAVPTTVFARYDAYVVTYKKDGVEHVGDVWERRGPEQNAKCAEALALRQAFPEDLSELYTFDEMAKTIAEFAPEPQTEEKRPETPQTTASPEAVAAPGPVSDAPATEKPSRPQSDKELEPAGPEPKAPKTKRGKKAEGAEKSANEPETPKIEKAPETSPPAEAEKPKETEAAPEAMEGSEFDTRQPDPNRKPSQAELQEFYDRAKNIGYLLTNAGLAPARGMTAGAKLKRFILTRNAAKELGDLTAKQWAETLDGLKTLLAGDLTKKDAVEAVENANKQ